MKRVLANEIAYANTTLQLLKVNDAYVFFRST